MEPKTGSFCWLELGTTDQSGAKQFYSNLFGWTTEDMPMGPDMTYTLFRLGGKDVAGAYKLMKEQIESRVPPNWLLYVKVDNADAAAAKAVKSYSPSSSGARLIISPSASGYG